MEELYGRSPQVMDLELLKHIEQPVFRVDKRRSLYFYNSAFKTYFNCADEEDLNGRSILGFFELEFRNQLEDKVKWSTNEQTLISLENLSNNGQNNKGDTLRIIPVFSPDEQVFIGWDGIIQKGKTSSTGLKRMPDEEQQLGEFLEKITQAWVAVDEGKGSLNKGLSYLLEASGFQVARIFALKEQPSNSNFVKTKEVSSFAQGSAKPMGSFTVKVYENDYRFWESAKEAIPLSIDDEKSPFYYYFHAKAIKEALLLPLKDGQHYLLLENRDSIGLEKQLPFYFLNKVAFLLKQKLQLDNTFQNYLDKQKNIQEISTHLNDASWLRTKEKMLLVSPVFEKIWEMPMQKLDANPNAYLDVVHPEDKEEVLHKVGNTKFESGKILDITFRIQTKQKEEKWIWLKSVPVFDEHRKVSKRVTSSRDITSFKKTQIALEKETKALNSFFLVSDDLMCIGDISGSLLRINPSWEKHFGFSEKLMRDTDYFSFVHPDDLQKVQWMVETLASGESVRGFVCRCRDIEGTYHHLEWNMEFLDGYIYSSARVITEQLEYQSKLKSSEEKFRLLSENSNDLIALHEPNGDIIYVSPSLKELLGYEVADWVGNNAYVYFLPKDREKVRSQAKQKFEQKESLKWVEYRIKHAEGHYLWMESLIRPIEDESGNIVQLQSSTRDISKRKQIEEELLKANESKDKILATVVHDLRNPIMGIRSMINLLKQEMRGGGEHEAALNLMKRSCDDSLGIIKDLLLLSELDLSEVEFEEKEVNLEGLLKDIFNPYQKWATEKGLHLELNLSTERKVFKLGDKELKRAIENVLSNAMKFTPQGGSIVFSVWEEQKMLYFSIRDNGVGIPKHLLPVLFDKFTKAKRKGLSGEPSTGLGMSITKNIIEKLGGNISVESVEGKGTTIVLAIPII